MIGVKSRMIASAPLCFIGGCDVPRLLKSRFVILAAVIAVAAVIQAADVPTPVTAVVVDPTDGALIYADQNGLSDSRFVSELSQIHDLQFSPDGSRLAVAGGVSGEQGQLEVFDTSKPQTNRTLFFDGSLDVVYAVAWSPDGRYLGAASLDGTAQVIDTRSGKAVARLAGHSRGVTAIAFIEDTVLVTGSLDESLRVWKLDVRDESGCRLLRTLSNHTGAVTGIAVRPAEPNSSRSAGLPMIASVSEDRTMRLWQPTIGRMVRFVRLDSVPVCATWLPDGSQVVIGGRDGSLRQVDPDSVEVLHFDRLCRSPVMSVAVTRDGQFCFIGSGRDGVQKAAVRIPH